MNTPWGRRLGAVSLVGLVITVVLVVGVVKVARHHDRKAAAQASVPASPSAGCRASPPAPGVTHAGFTSQGASRTYRLFVPQGLTSPVPPLPLVVDIHGYSEGDDVHAAFTQWEAKAQSVGAEVVTPEGQLPILFWSLGFGKGIDDVTTIGDLLDHIEATTCVDTRRVFVDGFSNGAMLTTVLACRLSGRIAAFGAVSGLWDPSRCSPSRAVPILAFHGTVDPYLPYTGGTGPQAAKLPVSDASAQGLVGFRFGRVPASAAAWARRDGCASKAVTTQLAAHVTETAYGSCRGDGEVELLTLAGAGHTWPGSAAMDAVVAITGSVNHEISATDLLWAFFSAHPLPR